MDTLQDVVNLVTDEGTVIDSAMTLLDGLAAQVAALKPNQDSIDNLAANIRQKKQALVDAITRNTPAAGTGGGTTTPPADVVTTNADGSTTTVHTNPDGTKTTSTSADSSGNTPANNPDGSVNPSTV